MARTARVWLSFMVATDGTVYEPMIEQINNERFSANVIKWVKLRNYRPATVNGDPVDSVLRSRFSFNIGYGERSGRVSTKLFNKHYAAFNEELETGNPDQSKLAKLLKKMWGTKHGSELAYELLSSSRYKYARLFLNKEEQLYALHEMILSNDKGIAVIDGQPADVTLINLAIELGRYGEAINAYYSALRNHSSEIDSGLRQMFGPTIEQISEILTSDKAFARSVSIHPERTTFVDLKKNNFAFEDVSGDFTNLKLRCTRKFAKLPFAADSDYQIPEGWGDCQMQVLGTPGATAKLIQF